MVLALNRVGSARRQAALYYARERRRSLQSNARLFGNYLLAAGQSIDLDPVFPDSLTPVTFEGVARYEGAGSEGVALLSTGAVSLVTTSSGIRISSGVFVQNVIMGVGQAFRWNLAIRPGDAQVRLWIDSERRVAAQFGDAPFEWHAGGTLTYNDTDRVSVLSPLSIYYQQRPRHFGDANVVLPGGEGVEDILFRAAIATFLTGAFPFVDKPDPLETA